MSRIEYDRDIDIVNIEVFQRFGVEAPSVPRHRCVICKKPVSIDYSYSFSGHMLICMGCFYKHFDGELHKVADWWDFQLEEMYHDRNFSRGMRNIQSILSLLQKKETVESILKKIRENLE